MQVSVRSAPVVSPSKSFVSLPAGSAAYQQRVNVQRLTLQRAHRVEIILDGKSSYIEVGDGESVLEAALDKGLDLPHDCKMGVCMTCPAKLVSEMRLAA